MEGGSQFVGQCTQQTGKLVQATRPIIILHPHMNYSYNTISTKVYRPMSILQSKRYPINNRPMLCVISVTPSLCIPHLGLHSHHPHFHYHAQSTGFGE